MNTRILLSFLLVAFSASITASAQQSFSGWLASFNSFKTGKKTSIHFDAQFRSTDEWQGIQTILLRPGINFHLSKKTILTGGYAFVQNRIVVNNVTGRAVEHRIWEQFIFAHKLNPILITHRFRLEQRFIPHMLSLNNELEKDGYSTSNRFRYFLRNILPLKKQDIFKKGMFLALQNEVFLNLFGQQNVNGKFFDQNRFYLAAGYRVSSKADLEIGYMNQYVSGRTTNLTNNIIQLASYLRL
jgi:hypothetical protein